MAGPWTENGKQYMGEDVTKSTGVVGSVVDYVAGRMMSSCVFSRRPLRLMS